MEKTEGLQLFKMFSIYATCYYNPTCQCHVVGMIEEAGRDMTSDRVMHISGDLPYTCDPTPLRYS